MNHIYEMPNIADNVSSCSAFSRGQSNETNSSIQPPERFDPRSFLRDLLMRPRVSLGCLPRHFAFERGGLSQAQG
jgi:hypothetical protein